MIKAINATDRFYAMALDKKPQFQRELPKERGPRKPSDKPLERDILRDIMQALRRHPKVATVERRQSGVFMDGNRYVRAGRRGEPDIGGILRGGRAFAIEVKRPGEQPTEIQAIRLQEISAAGGISGCAHGVSEALAIIEGT